MKRLRDLGLLILVLALVVGGGYSGALAQDEIYRNDPNADEMNVLDVLFARPIGIVAGIIGTGVFIAALPFTIPTRSVDEAARKLIVEPFRFSFARKYNEDIDY